MEKLTNKQIIILDFIKKYTAKNGYSPTIREICEGVHLSSPATVFVHIKNLETKEKFNEVNEEVESIPKKDQIDLKSIDDRLMTIDDFLN